jgi:hypothetical protein
MGGRLKDDAVLFSGVVVLDSSSHWLERKAGDVPDLIQGAKMLAVPSCDIVDQESRPSSVFAGGVSQTRSWLRVL